MNRKNLRTVERKPLMTIICLTVFVVAGYAQDIITQHTGDIIKAKILEVGIEKVRYKAFTQPNGPDFVISASKIFMIKYENGHKDVFEKNPATGKIQIRHIVAEPAPVTTVTVQQSDTETATTETPVTAKPTTPKPTTTTPTTPKPTTPTTPKPTTPKPTPTTPKPTPTPAPKPAAVIPSGARIGTASNGTFTMLKLEGATVSFRAAVKTPIYMVSLTADGQTVDAATIKNTKGDIVFSNGATAWAGSSLMMGKPGMILPKETEVQCDFENAPSGFTAKTVVFKIDEKSAVMSYDIASGAWINPQAQETATETVVDSSVSETVETPSAPDVIKFKDGSCRYVGLNLRPMFAPANMSDKKEKAFSIDFDYTLSDKTDLNILHSDGRFVSPDGKSYQAGVAFYSKTTSIYTLIVAVPKDVDVMTLKFVFDGHTIPLNKLKK
jgi:hypothetical protein